MFGMALVVIVMGVSLASCSKENPDGGDFSNEKKLVNLTSSDGASFRFIYDEKGRMIKAIEVSDYFDGGEGEFLFSWGDNAIKCGDVTFTLENGLVQREEDHEWWKNVYFYNQSNRLIGLKDQEIYMWDGDKLVSVSDVDGNERTHEITITYEKSCKRGYNPLFAAMTGLSSSDYLLLGHPELFGLRTKQLPKTVTINGTDITDTIHTFREITSFSYEFDKDGYISKMVIDETHNGKSSPNVTWTLAWE